MGFLTGFAQGAMAAMPAATDRYVQARRRANERKQLVQDRKEARALEVQDRNALEKKGLMTKGSELGLSFTGNESSDEMRARIADFVSVQRDAELTRQQGFDDAEAANRDLQRQVSQANLDKLEQQKDPRFTATQNLLGLGVPYNMLYSPDGSYTEDGIGQGRIFLADKKQKEKQREINFGYSYEERQAQIESMRERLTILQGESNAQFALDALTVYERSPTKANFDAAFKSYGDWAKAPYRQKKPDSSGQQGPTTEMSSKDNKFLEQSNLTVATEKLRLREKEAEAAANMRQAMGGDVLQGFPLLSYGLKPSTGGGVQSTVAETQGTIPLGDTRNARPNLMTSMEDSSSVTPSFSIGDTSGSTSIDSLGGGDDLSSLDDLTISNRALKGDEAAIQEAERRELF